MTVCVCVPPLGKYTAHVTISIYNFETEFVPTVTLVTPVRMTVPVTDKKCPTSLDLGMVSLVSSGHTGRPVHTYANQQTTEK